ncbi:MAG TPA: fibronectin type III domain-containing protein [Candidatus Eisenbacteria bacterium]|nr:fibronectin type III domain-containing protein [Candidatus Eisenbacteria bacterium]
MSKELYRLNAGMGIALLGIIALTAMVLHIYAASLQNRKDTLSNQSASGTSTHTITFNLSASNSFTSGEQISVDIPETSAFTQSGTWTTADFAFADGVARTIDAVNVGPGITTVSCTNGANNVGVALDTTNLIFRVIPCGALFTPSATGAFVTFTISGQSPNGILTNPPATGAYFIYVLNGAGDCLGGGDDCSMGIVIVDNDTVNVTADVAGSPTPPPPPPPDTTPPAISNISVTGITSTSATVNWSTDEIADSTVNYGLTASYGSQVTNAGLVASHSLNLTGLTDGTLYHFQVCSKDASNNQACSADQTFTTTDTAPPVISNVQVTGITQTGATVTWTTNENATSFVDYGLSAGPPYANTSGNATLVTSHSVTLSGLTASTVYHYRVRSGDAASNESFTSDATFTTASPVDTTAPVISNIQVTGLTVSAATITWTTNEPATSFVDYGLTAGYGSTSGNATLVTSHSVPLSGLSENTLYHFRVRSADAASNEAVSGDNTFTTLDGTAPIISNVQVSAITGTSATVTWTTNEAATSFVDYGTTISYGSTAGNGTLVTSHSVNLTGLTSQTLYHFRVRSADSSSNEATSSDGTFTTLDTTPPAISNVQSSGITTTAATITWTTDENSDSVVEYGTTVSYGSTQSNASMVTSHSIGLTGLTPSTLYHFRVKSKDAANNQATSGDFTFTTLTPPDTTAPVISNIQVINIAATSATVTWDTNEPATSFVDYGLTVGYGSTAGNGTLVTSHSVNLTGLTSQTLYHFRVRSADAASNSSNSSDGTFTTLDVNAPVITNVQVTGITETGATVTWTTNENATSFVDYGTTVSYGSTAGVATPRVTSHSVTLSGLTASTTYHFRVRSADVDNNETTSTDDTFATIDSTPPVISAVTATGITTSAATITWTTNENSDSVVEYGTTVSYGSTASSATMVTSHSVNLSGLTADTLYHYRVKSKDAANNQATSGDFTFTTLKPPPPVISNIQVSAITQTSATVSWDTDVASDSKVDFGSTAAYGNTTASATMVTSHSINLTGLVKNHTYHYRVRSQDSFAQETVSPDDTFNTAADTTPPANVSPFTATAGNQSVSLSWGNPTDPDFDRVKIIRKTGGSPTGPNDGAEIYNGNGTAYVDTGLTNGTTYFYGAYAYDDVPNYASGAFASATPAGPADTTPPANVSGLTATPGNQQVALNWTNPTDPDFAGVRIVRKTAGFSTGPNDGTIIYTGADQTFLDTGLTNGTTYYYTVYSFDGPLNFSSGAQASATPVPPPDTTPPSAVTNFKAVAGDTEIQLTWTNPTNPDWAGTRIVRKIGSDPTSFNDGTIVFDGMGDFLLDTGLVNDTEYHYGAYAYDPSLNFATGAFVHATPKAGAVPPPPPACTDSDGGKSYEVQGTVTAGASSFPDSCTDSSTLREYYCDGATAKNESHDCGTGFKCSAGRCTADVVTTEICGNGSCAGSENSINCAVDCPVAPTAPPAETTNPSVPQQQRLSRDDFKFFATAGRMQLQVDDNGGISVYTKMTMTVYLPDASIKKPIKSAFVNLGGSAYTMKKTASYEAATTIPANGGSYPLKVVVNYEDNTSDSVDFTVIASPRGLVYESIDGKNVAVADARVTLLVDNGGGFGVWDSGNTKQLNPVVTDETGKYSFIVQPGTYKLKAEKEGYITRETLAFPVTDENIITESLLLTNSQLQATAEQVRDAISNPIVEKQAEQVAAPTAVAAAVANVASAGAATATAIPYLLYVWSFFAHPTLLIARRRRKKWGVVYNALSKLPLDLAIVRLLDAKTGRILRSAVTDKDGRYFFIVQAGEYKMSAVKAGFVFPTAYLKGAKEDINFVDLYHGENIVVREETAITANIPLDPVTVEKTPLKIMLEGIGRRFQKSLGVISIIAMAIAVVITPTPLMIALLAGNIVMYFVFRRLAIPPKPKNWGIVYDEASGKPVQNVVARIFESKYNKLLETQVTDTRGRYAFLVGNNVYYVTFEKPGYQKQQKGPIDLTKKLEKKTKAQGEAAQLVAVDVKLQPAAGGAKPEEKKSALPPPPPPVSPQEPTNLEPPPKPPAGPTMTSAATSVPPVPASLASTPAVSAAEPAAAPAAKPAASKIPWEVQMLARLKKTAPGAGAGTTPPAAPSSPPPAPPLPPPAASLTGSPEPAMGEKKPETPPTPSAPPPVPPPAAAQTKPAGLLQDTDHAHPDVKLIEDEAHAHPEGTPKEPPVEPKTPPPDDKLPGPDDAVKEL